jgi:hypothetical protein
VRFFFGTSLVTTWASLIERAEDAARAAKRTADVARDVSRASPPDPALKLASAAAADDAAAAGRSVAALRFEEQLDRWVAARDDVPADELLLSLAPRAGGKIDAYWLAAAHLAQAGVAVPRNWRSPVTGEPVNANPDPNES